MALVTPLNDFFGTVADRGLALLGISSLGKTSSVEGTIDLCKRFMSTKGNASGLALSYQILKSYEAFSDEQKTDFFQLVLSSFSTDIELAKEAAQIFVETQSIQDLDHLKSVTRPQYAQLIALLNQTPAATMKILHMRSDLLIRLREHPELRTLDAEFVKVFSAWFNRGFLGLRNINWQTPAAILENVIKYEAVHGITDWDDLGRRIKPADRMIYGFFHPNLADEPLIFVEVALMGDTPNAISPILTETREPIDPSKATTAVFYSISNCQNGLRGIPLGNFLIKQVVEDLKTRFPHLKDFVTLSPIVKFGDWARAHEDYSALLTDDINLDSLQADDLEKTLMPAAAKFLSSIKAKDGKPLDPVCRFHIGNGARLERLNWAARLDDIGLTTSYGIMANYRYIIDDIEKNHEAFETDGTVTVSNNVKKLASLNKS